ncbi:arginase family protein [Frischella sp. Ac48]|uniref:Arginase family protein n=1 Tax=Frischella japonica TaxID=2741544 RepID=A0ABR7QVB8_9GAMM|nr:MULTISPECIES: arginase family protein [Frischella]MBC9130167.1 arginase family protein [Frischella japonica]MBX4133151.1 arginase family protein [Frischella sp. Ac48]
MRHPVILNFDDSIGEIEQSIKIDLTEWQESIRFGCSFAKYKKLAANIYAQLPAQIGTVLMGSGDYHHISLMLIERLKQQLKPKQQIQVVIFDNHPDNMRYPFGIHCGSWVSHAAKLPFISHVHVIGITSPDIGIFHAWENRLTPLLKNKLTYWCMDVNVNWAKKLGMKNAFLKFNSPNELITAFIAEQYHDTSPVYLSIDKDVLSEEVVKTNWDQGKLKPYHLYDVIAALNDRIIGSDICGEISTFKYASRFKQFLSQLDQQPMISESDLKAYQSQQQALNLELLSCISQPNR